MKPQVAIEFTNVIGTDSKVRMVFDNLEDLDELLGTLVEMRDDLEEQIECEKQRRHEKRQRRKERKRAKEAEDYIQKIFDDIRSSMSDTNSTVYHHKDESNIDASYDKLNEILKDFNKSLDEYMEQFKDKDK